MLAHGRGAVLGVVALALLPASAQAKRTVLETFKVYPGERRTTDTSFEHGGEHIAILSGTQRDEQHWAKYDGNTKVGEDVYLTEYDSLWAYNCQKNGVKCDEFHQPYYGSTLQVEGAGGYLSYPTSLNAFSEDGKAPAYDATSHTYRIPVDYATGPLLKSLYPSGKQPRPPKSQ
jgi:hypothetical protein